MRKYLIQAIAISTLIIAGCSEDIDTSSRYVFKEETITSYLSKHDQYSEYFRLMNEVLVSTMSETNVSQLLSARGHYTVFAPTTMPSKPTSTRWSRKVSLRKQAGMHSQASASLTPSSMSSSSTASLTVATTTASTRLTPCRRRQQHPTAWRFPCPT